MRRFLTAALLTGTLTLNPVIAHAAPKGSESRFLSYVEKMMTEMAARNNYKFFKVNPVTALEMGRAYCHARAKGLSGYDISVARIISINDYGTSKAVFKLVYWCATDMAASMYLCPKIRI